MSELDKEVYDFSFSKKIWSNLSQVDVSERIEKKGGFSYLSWSWAWGILMNEYPSSTFDMLPERSFPDKSVEVRCSVTEIAGEESLTRYMWLPVMNHSNRAI